MDKNAPSKLKLTSDYKTINKDRFLHLTAFFLLRKTIIPTNFTSAHVVFSLLSPISAFEPFFYRKIKLFLQYCIINKTKGTLAA